MRVLRVTESQSSFGDQKEAKMQNLRPQKMVSGYLLRMLDNDHPWSEQSCLIQRVQSDH